MMKMKELEPLKRFKVLSMMPAAIHMTSFVVDDSHKYRLKRALVPIHQSLDVYSRDMDLTNASLLSKE